MAGLKNGAQRKSQDVCRVETAKSAEISLALVKRGEDRVVTVHSPAKELQSQLDAAVTLDWRYGAVQEAAPAKRVLTGMVVMTTLAVLGWFGLSQVVIALI